jgi:Skp family chaperone for outer membrane proteins
MRGFVIVLSLAFVLSAAPTFAQTPPPAQAKPAQQPPPPTPPPTTPPPAQIAPPPGQPPAPFPQGAKIGFVNFQRVVQESADGKASSTKIQALSKKKQDEGTAKAQQLKSNQDKLAATGSVMSDAARSQLEKEIERQQVEAQRFQQDAQAELNELQQELQADFIKKVTPILQQVATEKGLYALFNAQEAGFAWVDPGLDLTTEVIKKLDAQGKPATTPKP